jgi:trehalose 6-phosphate phosphatase
LAGPPLALRPGELTKRAPLSSSAYFLDVDGTLLEIKPHPEDVVADKVLRTLLTELAAAMGGALGLVSGRTIGDLDRIFAPLIFPAVGLHGAEIRFPDGARLNPTNGAMDAVRESLTDFVAAHEGLRLEDKGAALAVHFRQAPDLADKILKFVDALAKNSGLALQPGKMVAELKQAHHDKGRGIAALLANPPFSGREPVFIGDDVTDESGFLFVNVQGGISVRAGSASASTNARYYLRDPAEVRAELSRLLLGQEAGPLA